MTREEFKKMHGNPPLDAKVTEGDKITIWVKLKVVYNKAIDALRPSLRSAPLDYQAWYSSYVFSIAEKQIENLMSKEELLSLISLIKEKSKLAKFLIENNKIDKIEIEVIPSTCKVEGIPHHYTVYAMLNTKAEFMHLYWGQKYKRKVLLFLNEGVLELKYPPYDLQDDPLPLGVSATHDGHLIIVE